MEQAFTRQFRATAITTFLLAVALILVVCVIRA